MYSSKTKKIRAFTSTVWTKSLFLSLCLLWPGLSQLSTGQEVSEGLKYATNLRIEGSTIVVPRPSPGLPEARYILDEAPERIICTSTTHLHYLELLGLEDKLVGFPGTQYIYSEKFREKVTAGAI